MPYAFVPPGYRAVLLGQAADIEDLGTFAPLEESSAEGALVLMRLDFTEAPAEETLSNLEQVCRGAGVEPWPGSQYYVYADTATSAVYLVWQKGMAWLPVIIGLLATVVLPPILTAGIWLILPDSLKSLISSLINMGMMMFVLFLVMKMMPALSPNKEKPKRIEEKSE
ncbi:hypothetical protein ACFLVC_02065 [Chloroflexota bacterium]